ncbi:MAG: hypothetical protein EP347_11645 [Alphaproteobacteria bacterium]|nr:MAG: hypothetical protein EP347_11645 [Alphaproteobacteria bacterium]
MKRLPVILSALTILSVLLASSAASATGLNLSSTQLAMIPQGFIGKQKALPQEGASDTQNRFQVTLTWSMPERYDASWKAYDEAEGTYSRSFINPAKWELVFDLCNATGPQRIDLYELKIEDINGRYSKTSANQACQKRFHDIPSLGTYKVTYRLRAGQSWSRSYVQEIKVRDYLIVSIGDSVSSGEGNPDAPAKLIGTYLCGSILKPADADTMSFAEIQAQCELLSAEKDLSKSHPNAIALYTPAGWVDDSCHRSKNNFAALYAKELERNDPHSSVTFLSFACSGAKITSGILGPYAGVEGSERPTPMPGQLDQVKQTVGSRWIDSMLVTAGANDLDWDGILKKCVEDYPLTAFMANICGGSTDVGDSLSTRLDGLETAYCRFFGKLSGRNSCLKAAPLEKLMTGIGAWNSWDGVNCDNQGTACNRSIDPFGNLNIGELYLLAYPKNVFGEGGGCRPEGIAEEVRKKTYKLFPAGGVVVGAGVWGASALIPAAPALGGAPIVGLAVGIGIAEVWARFSGFNEDNAAFARYASQLLYWNQTFAAHGYQWNYVTETGEAFVNHSICDNDKYLVTIPQSFESQRDIRGSFHPNMAGHKAMAKVLTKAVKNNKTPSSHDEVVVQIHSATLSHKTKLLEGGGLIQAQVVGPQHRIKHIAPINFVQTGEPVAFIPQSHTTSFQIWSGKDLPARYPTEFGLAFNGTFRTSDKMSACKSSLQATEPSTVDLTKLLESEGTQGDSKATFDSQAPKTDPACLPEVSLSASVPMQTSGSVTPGMQKPINVSIGDWTMTVNYEIKIKHVNTATTQTNQSGQIKSLNLQ